MNDSDTEFIATEDIDLHENRDENSQIDFGIITPGATIHNIRDVTDEESLSTQDSDMVHNDELQSTVSLVDTDEQTHALPKAMAVDKDTDDNWSDKQRRRKRKLVDDKATKDVQQKKVTKPVKKQTGKRPAKKTDEVKKTRHGNGTHDHVHQKSRNASFLLM